MVNDFGGAIGAFVAMPEARHISATKELSTTNINTKGAAPNRKMACHHIVYFCDCETPTNWLPPLLFTASQSLLLNAFKSINDSLRQDSFFVTIASLDKENKMIHHYEYKNYRCA